MEVRGDAVSFDKRILPIQQKCGFEIMIQITTEVQNPEFTLSPQSWTKRNTFHSKNLDYTQ